MKVSSERIIPKKVDRSSFYLEHIQRYRFCKRYVAKKLVLDVGCGVGYGSYELTKLGASFVNAVDIDKASIRYATKNYSNPKIRFEQSDALNLSFTNNSFDVIISMEVIEHVKNVNLFLREILRVLKPNGYCILSTPNRLQYRAGTSLYHEKEFSVPELKKQLSAHGVFCKIYGQKIKSKKFVQEEIKYFNRYQRLTLGSNRFIKKLFTYIPSLLKSSIYKLLWGQQPILKSSDFIISGKKLDQAITLIAVCQKIK